ncbi:hypothetical protein [Streptomyces sp. NPDC004230]
MVEVVWDGRWEHSECGASGEALFDDETSPQSGHEESGEIGWYGQWYCHGCGAEGDDEWEDGDPASSGHECDEDELDEIEGAAA